MLDDFVSERFPGQLGVAPELEAVAQGGRHPAAVVGVRVAGERRFQRQFVVHAVQPGRDHRGNGQVRVHVAAGDPVLHPERRAVPDQPQRAGPVVHAPAHRGGREAARDVPLVGVDVRRVAQRQLAQRGQLPGDEVLAERGQAMRAVAGHDRLAVATADRQVDVARVALTGVGLGHEGQAHALLPRDLLRSGLVDGMVVARDQRLGVAERDLVLAQVALALGRLHLEPGARHPVPQPAQQRLDLRGAHDRVVHVVGVGRGQVAVAGGLRLGVRVLVHDELELGAGQRGQPALGQPLGLRPQDLPRRGHHRRAVVPGQVGQHHDGAFVPGHPAQRAHVRHHHEVAVAAAPRGHRVPVYGVHLDVHREQVVAPLDDVPDHLVQEVVGREPLAGQPSLHVGEGDDHRVDDPLAHLDAELLQGEHPAPFAVRGGSALLFHGPPVSAAVLPIVLPGPPGKPARRAWCAQPASSSSMAASSSGVPWTRGPVNQLRAETAQ